MDEYERLKLRMQCLETAKEVSIAAMDPNSIETRTEWYWHWITKRDPPTTMAATSTGGENDIPF